MRAGEAAGGSAPGSFGRGKLKLREADATGMGMPGARGEAEQLGRGARSTP